MVYLQTTSAVTDLAARKNQVSLRIWIWRRNHCTFAAPLQQTAVYQLRIPGDMNDTCTNSSINPRVELFQLIMYTPTFILGLLFNVLALSFLFFPAKKLSEPTVYLIALIFLDTLLLFTLPFKIISYHLQDKWKLGAVFCSILESLYFINMYGSILISLCICVDRYIAIQHPFMAPTLRSTKKAALVCVVICLGISAGAVSTSRFHEESYNISSCFHNFSNSTWENKGLIITLEMMFFGSMVAMAFCTIQIIRCLRNHRKSENSQTHMTRAEKVVVTNFVTFLVCFTPYHVMFFLYFLVRNSIVHIPCHTVLRDVLQVTLCWANLNCCLDAVCYYFVLKESADGLLQNKERNHPEESFDPNTER
ncbi:lysophosphatidic acid receptor 6-like isoform X3 [Coturnix japonica]|uniref:lysophosphatidic acid receptor 6-like isoform X3 n=1 Tax=Coturnix japonica TaxID=93934 RepID=UPI0013A5E7EE|nr:lysophosphatidic acid receptor 6-like isoform X3 [Coturnix japonica]